MLSRGFTTVRDVGGANRHYREATEQWLIPGPRLFQGGPVMSQTGGHGKPTSYSPFSIKAKISQATRTALMPVRAAVRSPPGLPEDTSAPSSTAVSFLLRDQAVRSFGSLTAVLTGSGCVLEGGAKDHDERCRSHQDLQLGRRGFVDRQARELAVHGRRDQGYLRHGPQHGASA